MKCYVLICTIYIASCAGNLFGASAQRINGTSFYGQVDVNEPATQIPSAVRPLVDVFMRDTQVTRGRDGWYYMTGTTAIPDGIRVWKSQDLKTWEPMGLVWSLDECKGWQRNYYVYPPNQPGSVVPPEQFNEAKLPPNTNVRRACWAPEIHYFPKQNNYFLVGCMNHNVNVDKQHVTGHKLRGGTFVLRSKTGKPEGPYEDISPDHPLTADIDANLFEDEDGKIYLVYQNGTIALLKDDLSGLAEEPRLAIQQKYEHEPYIEGTFLFKYKGRYVLSNTIWSVEDPEHGGFHYAPSVRSGRKPVYSYDAVIAFSDSIYGPYGIRTTSLTGGGHGNFFVDHEGQWWACIFNNPRGELAKKLPFLCRPAIVPMKWGDKRLAADANKAKEFYELAD